MPKKKKKVIQMKSVSDTGVNTEAQHKVPERVEQYQKILPKEVFGKAASSRTQKPGKVPKGSHRMPDGSIMKDSEMKPKPKAKGKGKGKARSTY